MDLGKAVETARRVAERAAEKVPPPTTYLNFERGFASLWAKGKGEASEVGAFLRQLPQGGAEFVAFVGEALSDEVLEPLVVAAEASLPLDEAAQLLCRLSAARRFDMVWMFVASSAAKGAVQRVLSQAGGGEEVAAAAKKYGVKLV